MLLLTDLRKVFGTEDKMATVVILKALHTMDERPWNDLRGRPVDSRWLSRQLAKYGVQSKDVRTKDGRLKGYTATDLHDPWSRYVADVARPLWKLGDIREGEPADPVGEAAKESATSATTATDDPELCTTCDRPLLLVLPGRTRCAGCTRAGAA